ncbi:MAG: SDR family NAD(P)-dependent oxidoreductase [Myxococcota bacterium]
MKKADFAGKWVLVTGASSGLGEEFARQLAHRGANLILTARSQDKLRYAAEDLARVNGISTHYIVADLGEASGIKSLLTQIDALGIAPTHVVNNAGFGSTGPLGETDAENEARMVRVNSEAVMSITRHFLPSMLARGEGGFIQVASTAAFQPTPFMTTYGATKAFVLSFSLALAEELHGSPLRVLAFCPGPVVTGFQRAAGIQKAGLVRMAKLEAPRVVRTALDAYDDGRIVVVPGTLNAVQAAAVRVLPRGIVLRATRWAMQGLGRA